MTKERSVAGRSDSWWCPTCGNIQNMNCDKKEPAEKEPENPKKIGHVRFVRL